ncbi:MAG: hypothetical protein ACP5XB_17650 [Isosphaeraceae bacterium]
MSKEHGRTHWLDEATDTPLIQEYAHRLNGFMEAMADGKIDPQELQEQEARLVEVMKRVEPELSDKLHADVTRLLCELSAYNIMHTLHELAAARPKTKFRG